MFSHPTGARRAARTEKLFLTHSHAETYLAFVAHRLQPECSYERGASAPRPARFSVGWRVRWQKRIADLRRWIATSSARSRAKVARPHTRRGPRTSGRAKRRGKPGGRAAWRATVGSRSNSNSRGPAAIKRTPTAAGPR